jgi:DsbC/DsbD-like thiol-disulfide interchange protein
MQGFPWVLRGFAAGLAMLAAAAAAAPVKTEHVEAELVAERAAVAPGQTVTVALVQRIIPHWHTYWLNPGESGLPTEIAWSLPEGWSAGPIQWPTPQRIPVGPLMNYGYEDVAVLLVDVTAAAGAKAGTAHLKAEANWLVCEEICVPETVALSLDLGVAAAAAAPSSSEFFAQARAALPQQSPFAAQFRSAAGAASLSLALPNAEQAKVTEAYFFPEADSIVEASAPQEMSRDKDGLHLSFKPARAEAPAGPVRGILQLTELVNGEPQLHAFAVAADLVPGAPVRANAAVASAPALDDGTTIAQAIFLALLGGLILNLMPCVFPVLSMKALALVSHRGEHARMHGRA